MRLINADALETKKKTIYMEYENVVVPTKVIPITDLYLASTVDAEIVRHGHWIHKGSYIDDDFDRVFEYYCSICGRCIQVYDDIAQYPYCHCGAKMDAGVEGC